MLSVAHRVVLVEIERHDVREAQPLLAMHPDQLAVDADRRRAGGEAEHRPLAGGVASPDQRRDAVGDEARDVLVVVDDDRADRLEPASQRAATREGPRSRERSRASVLERRRPAWATESPVTSLTSSS